MNIKPIKSEQDYQLVLKRLETVFDAPIDSVEGDEAELLSMLIENYENVHFPIETPDPIEAIRIRMEEMDMKQKDLVGIIGGKSRVSEVLHKKKKLTIEMVRKLSQKLNLPASLLVSNYELTCSGINLAEETQEPYDAS
jgi:HTH-type transcriptional regulator/antitoxin HigA